MTPSQLEQLPEEIRKLIAELEIDIMADLVRRIRINAEVTRSADWQIHRLHELGSSSTWIKSRIQEYLYLMDEEIDRMFTIAAETDYARDKELYEYTGKKFVPYKENEQLQQFVKAVQEQTKEDCRNITQSMGFVTKDGNRHMALSEYYRNSMDKAVMKVSSGAFDYNTSLRAVVSEMTKSGISYIDYDTGYRSRVEVATRRAVMTGIAQVTEKITQVNAKELDTEFFEISWHGTARPTHQVWQGQVYSKEQLESVCGLGSVDGLHGANCYHDYFPFVPGISVRTYTDEELDKMNADEQKKRKFEVGGKVKEYNRYKAAQRQRQLEALMRRQRQEIVLLKEGEAANEDIAAARARYRGTMQQYVRFSQEMELPQQKERIYMDGLGRV